MLAETETQFFKNSIVQRHKNSSLSLQKISKRYTIFRVNLQKKIQQNDDEHVFSLQFVIYSITKLRDEIQGLGDIGPHLVMIKVLVAQNNILAKRPVHRL